MKRIAYIGLGSNQGDVAEALNSAIESLRSIEQTDFIDVSPYIARHQSMRRDLIT